MAKWVRGYDGERHNLDNANHLRTIRVHDLMETPSDIHKEHEYAAAAIFYPFGSVVEAILFTGSKEECDNYRRELVGVMFRGPLVAGGGNCNTYYDPRDQAEAEEQLSS